MQKKDLRKLIKETAFFRCTFKKVRKKGHLFKKEVLFYVIGVLPIIVQEDGKSDVRNLNAFVEAEGKPVMKHIQGLKYKDKLIKDNYKDEAKMLVDILAKNYVKVATELKIGDVDIEKIKLLKVAKPTKQ